MAQRNMDNRIAALSPEQRRSLEERLLERVAAGAGNAAIPRRAGAPFPLSSGEQRLWFLNQIDPNSSLYNIARAFRLRGTLNIGALERSLTEIIRRHEALRTTFVSVDGRPQRLVSDNQPFVLHHTDVRTRAASEREQAIRELIALESYRPFDLAEGPLARALLVKASETDHFLLLVVHHIVFDGWSIAILQRELSVLYRAFSEGEPSPLPVSPIRYSDFAAWQQARLQQPAMEVQLDYWMRQLDGAPTVLELPTDRPRPPRQSFRGAQQEFYIPPSLAKELAALSRREGVTLFVTLLAAFEVLLARYTGQDDLLVGTPIAGRIRRELEDLIGFCVNTLVLRADLSANPTLLELLQRVRDTAYTAYAHQELPFEKLVEELHVLRDASHPPLVQVLFALQNAPTSPLKLAGLTVEPLRIETVSAKFDLTLSISPSDEGLTAALEYSADLFDWSTIARFGRHYRTLLEGIVDDPGVRVLQLPFMAAAERGQLLSDWNNTTRPLPSDRCIHLFVQSEAVANPTAIAVISEGERLTYQELNERANQLAHHLRRLGVAPDVLVGICAERSIEMIVGLLAILKAGGAYVPFDPTYPRERLAFMLEDTQAPVCLTQERLLEALPAYSGHFVLLEKDWPAIAEESREDPVSPATPDNLAYVVYTSGSTGTPKGVAIPHRAITRLVVNADYVSMQPDDVVAQASNIAFDAATFEIWGALASGATLVIISKPVLLSAPDLEHLIERERVSILFVTTALFNELVRDRPSLFGRLRCLLFGGDRADVHSVREVLQHNPPRQLLHVYGPTETTTFATAYHVEQAPEGATTVPIGRPIANTQAYILDSRLEPQPVGVAGELHIGGDGLARGYLNRPDLTAEQFISNPFNQTPGSRLYKTGDIARYRPDGNIEFLGRLDDQIKVRGFRVEPGEVEATLRRYPSVQEAVVLANQDCGGDKQLLAYVVLHSGRDASEKDLRDFLRGKLPDWMVPAAVVVLDKLPQKPNGKLDRQALPVPGAQLSKSPSTPFAPHDELGRQLISVFEEVLGRGPIGPDDNFFTLGGTSLQAVRLVSSIEKSLGKRLALASIFQFPTVGDLARLMRDPARPSVWQSLVPIQSAGRRRPIFCVHSVTGDVACYHSLAAELGPDQPVYGLQARGLDGVQTPLMRVEDMARAYIEELRTVQPTGPYCLAGFSGGGLIAFEVARQLRVSGEKIAVLAILDRPGWGTHDEPPTWILRHLVKLFCTLRGQSVYGSRRGKGIGHPGAMAFDPARTVTGVRTWVKDVAAGLVDMSRHGGKPLASRNRMRRIWEAADPDYFAGWPEYRWRVLETQTRAIWAYSPQPYDGPVLLLRSREQPAFASRDPAMGWDALAKGGVTVVRIPGNHGNFLRYPQVRIVAAQLTPYLARA